LSAVSVEEGEAQAAPGAAEHQIDEEIEEIKRYEVCTNGLGELFHQLYTNSFPGFHNHRYL
jgi:hypothetical protein